jgi:hypothetical protein
MISNYNDTNNNLEKDKGKNKINYRFAAHAKVSSVNISLFF